MMKKLLLLFSCCLLILEAAPAYALENEFAEFALSAQNTADGPSEIIINNRILLKIKGKPISLMDVVRKMDFLFYRQYPQLASSLLARYQFYTTNWRHMLNTVIDDQLIMLDAEEKKIEVSDGDIRETLEDLFGPDVVLNLEKNGLAFDETWELLKTELTVNRMNQIMVRSKAQNDISPGQVKKNYEKMVQATPLEKKWIYQTLTVESRDEALGASVAEKAKKLLEEQKIAFTELPKLLKEENALVNVRISDEFERKEKELSLAHRAILETLTIGTFSAPISQTAKQDGTNLFRIFYLKRCEEGKKIALSEVEERLSRELMQKAVAKYGASYTEKLRKYYGITGNYLDTVVPEHFEPFAVR